MDAFTQKLLERTQARKEALAKRRQDLASLSPAGVRMALDSTSKGVAPSAPVRSSRASTERCSTENPVKSAKGETAKKCAPRPPSDAIDTTPVSVRDVVHSFEMNRVAKLKVGGSTTQASRGSVASPAAVEPLKEINSNSPKNSAAYLQDTKQNKGGRGKPYMIMTPTSACRQASAGGVHAGRPGSTPSKVANQLHQAIVVPITDINSTETSSTSTPLPSKTPHTSLYPNLNGDLEHTKGLNLHHMGKKFENNLSRDRNPPTASQTKLITDINVELNNLQETPAGIVSRSEVSSEPSLLTVPSCLPRPNEATSVIAAASLEVLGTTQVPSPHSSPHSRTPLRLPEACINSGTPTAVNLTRLTPPDFPSTDYNVLLTPVTHLSALDPTSKQRPTRLSPKKTRAHGNSPVPQKVPKKSHQSAGFSGEHSSINFSPVSFRDHQALGMVHSSPIPYGPSRKEFIQKHLDEAASQQTIVLQTSQALNLCYSSTEDRHGLPEAVEAERVLLVATMRRSLLLEEVQRLKTSDEQFGAGDLCAAEVSISGIKIPISPWYISMLQSGQMECGVHHFAILVKYNRTQLLAAKSVSTYDETESNMLVIPDKITIAVADPKQAVTLYLYAMSVHKNEPNRSYNGSKSKKLKIKSSKDRSTPGTPTTVFRTSAFTQVGRLTLPLQNSTQKKHTIDMITTGVPVDGFLLADVVIVPRFASTARGFLTLFEEEKGLNVWNRRWCVLQNCRIDMWKYPDDEGKKPSCGFVDLKTAVGDNVVLVPKDICARPHTFELMMRTSTGFAPNCAPVRKWIAADCKEERISWMDAIGQQLHDLKSWCVAAPSQETREIMI